MLGFGFRNLNVFSAASRCCKLLTECHQQHPATVTTFSRTYKKTATKVEGGEKESMENRTQKEARPLSYYSNLGIRRRKVEQLIRRTKEDESTSGTTEVKRMADFIDTLKEYNFTEEDVSKLIMKKPRIFDMSNKQLKKQINNLIRYGYVEGTLKKVILKEPNLLVYDDTQATMAARVKVLQEIDLFPKLNKDEAMYLAHQHPKLLSITDKSVFNARIYNLMSFGLAEETVHRLVLKQGNILLQTESTINAKIEYIINVLGGPSSLLAKFPRALTISLQRMKERHLYLVHEGLFRTGSDRRLTEAQLRAIVVPSDEAFVTHVTNSTMERYEEFRKQLSAGEGGSVPSGDATKESVEEEEDLDEIHHGADYDDDDENEDEDFEVEAEDVEEYDETDKRLFTSFRAQGRSQAISDKQWYDRPFPDIRNPEADSGDINWRKFDEKQSGPMRSERRQYGGRQFEGRQKGREDYDHRQYGQRHDDGQSNNRTDDRRQYGRKQFSGRTHNSSRYKPDS